MEGPSGLRKFLVITALLAGTIISSFFIFMHTENKTTPTPIMSVPTDDTQQWPTPGHDVKG
jgi:hypothetical protein